MENARRAEGASVPLARARHVPRPSAPNLPLDTDLCAGILEIARLRARRCGVSDDEREDCALDFLARVLGSPERFLLPPPPSVSSEGGPAYSVAWMASCAENWARDYQRRRKLGRRREVPWPALPDEEGGYWAWECPDCRSPTPERILLEGEFWQALRTAITRLQPEQRACFIAFHLEGRCVQHIAAACDRTPNAVKLTLTRARRQIARTLERRGWTEEELRAAVSEATPPENRPTPRAGPDRNYTMAMQEGERR